MNRRKHKLSRRITAVLLTFAMLFSMVPAAFAAEGEPKNTLVLSTNQNNSTITENDLIDVNETLQISLNDTNVKHELYVRLYDAANDKYSRPNSVTASIDDTNIAEVDSPQYQQSTLNITGLKEGEATLNVSVGEQSISVKIKVVENLVQKASVGLRSATSGIEYTLEDNNLTVEKGNYFLFANPADSEGKLIKGASFSGDITYSLDNPSDSGIYLNNNSLLFAKAEGTAEITAQIGDITSTLNLTVTEPKPMCGLIISAQDSELTARDIKTALERLEVPEEQLSISNGNVVVESIETTKDVLEQYYAAYAQSIGTDRQADSIAATVNKLFFNDQEIIDGWALNLNGSYFNLSGTNGNFILSLTALPGTEIVENPDQICILTLVNIDGNNEEEEILGYYGQKISLSTYTANDEDNPITGWQYQVKNDKGDWITQPSIINKDQTITLTADTRLIARHDTEPHYVRIVVLEDNQDTDVIARFSDGAYHPEMKQSSDNSQLGSYYYPKDWSQEANVYAISGRDDTYNVSLTEYTNLYDGQYSQEDWANLLRFMEDKNLLEIDETTLYSVSATQYDHAVAGQKIALTGEGNIEAGSPLTITTFFVSFKPEEVTITPADITVYTGGDGYESVMNGTGETTVESNGLPTPGYLITLPESINDEYFDGKQEAANLSGKIRFVYDGNGDGEYKTKDADRVWNLDLYSEGEKSQTAVGEDGVARYVYRMDADSLSGTPIRMLFTDRNEEIISDYFEIGLATGLFKTYDMTIYPGLLESGAIKAQVLVDENEDGKYSEDEVVIDNMSVNVGTARLTVRGTTNAEVIHAVGNDVDAVADNAHHITAVAPTDTTYYINESQVEVDPSNVSLLSDELVETEPLQEYIVDNNIANNGENFEYRYLDLVDNTNGNAYVTATNSVDVYWKIPEDADRDSLRIVHFNELDREYTDLDAMLENNPPEVYTLDDGLSVVEIENDYYLKFSTKSFSPFVLVWNEDDPYYPPYDPGDDDEEDPDTPALDKVNHFLYVEGYPEDYRTGEYSDNEDLWPVKPQGNITRAEVATIFYRLLKDEVREEIETDVNSLPDVNEDDWFNVTVSSLANMGAISGYEDGTFRPNEPISRAELAAMAVRFYDAFEAEYEEGTFLDVDGDEWYADAIAAAEELGIIGGYPDGTVRPEANITRAEACAIVNRTLGRVPDADHLLPEDEMKTWPDNPESAWFYADMQEATNGHEYEWITEDGNKVENWTDLLDKEWNDR